MGSYLSTPSIQADDTTTQILSQIASNPVMMYSMTYCGACTKAKTLLERMKVTPTVVQFDKEKEGAKIAGAVRVVSGMNTVPVVYIGGEKIGGCDDLVAGIRWGTVQEKLKKAGVPFEDII
jgi:glutaredoxin 3